MAALHSKPYRGHPADISIRLKPDLESALMVQLKQQFLDAPLCWYERPDGDLLLRAGNFCGAPKEAQFRQDAAGWNLARFQETYAVCDQEAK